MTARKLAVVLLASLLLYGCSGRKPAATEVDPDAAAKAILGQVEFRDDLVKAESGAAENYYKLDGTVAGYAIYVSGSGATAEEVAVIKVDDAKNLDGAKEILEKRVEDLKFRFEDYVPAEMVKLSDPVIVAEGTTAILVLADDPSAANQAARDALSGG